MSINIRRISSSELTLKDFQEYSIRNVCNGLKFFIYFGEVNKFYVNKKNASFIINIIKSLQNSNCIFTCLYQKILFFNLILL